LTAASTTSQSAAEAAFGGLERQAVLLDRREHHLAVGLEAAFGVEKRAAVLL